jgi:hypothetical protein
MTGPLRESSAIEKILFSKHDEIQFGFLLVPPRCPPDPSRFFLRCEIELASMKEKKKNGSIYLKNRR